MADWPKTISVCPECTSLIIGEHHFAEPSAGWYCEECAANFDEPRDVQVVPVEGLKE